MGLREDLYCSIVDKFMGGGGGAFSAKSPTYESCLGNNFIV